jgi:hypothetical protein
MEKKAQGRGRKWKLTRKMKEGWEGIKRRQMKNGREHKRGGGWV